MARYYESKTLIEFVKKYTPHINGETTMECVERAIREAPTADVVPKSEVERLEHLRAELSKEVADLQDALKCEKETNKHLSEEYISAQKEIARLEKASLPSYCQAVSEEEAIKIGKEYGRAEVAREIFEEIENMISPMLGLEDDKEYVAILSKNFAELKKKYTEGKTNAEIH